MIRFSVLYRNIQYWGDFFIIYIILHYFKWISFFLEEIIWFGVAESMMYSLSWAGWPWTPVCGNTDPSKAEMCVEQLLVINKLWMLRESWTEGDLLEQIPVWILRKSHGEMFADQFDLKVSKEMLQYTISTWQIGRTSIKLPSTLFMIFLSGTGEMPLHRYIFVSL